MNWLKKLRRVDWSNFVWTVAGFGLLAFCTILFSLACLMGKQSAAVQLLIFCTALLYVLPPRTN
jgi:hypothetical protein